MQSITTMSYRDIITIEPDKRGGKPFRLLGNTNIIDRQSNRYTVHNMNQPHHPQNSPS
jgi:hypothetical protein